MHADNRTDNNKNQWTSGLPDVVSLSRFYTCADALRCPLSYSDNDRRMMAEFLDKFAHSTKSSIITAMCALHEKLDTNRKDR
jgi:hypothetical protein